MQVRRLAVEGTLELTPEQIYSDHRGLVVSPFRQAAFAGATGRSLFPVAQTIHSQSTRGVMRGIHYTTTPPGMAKYAYCARGEAIYMVVDIRMGSPTFGKWDSVHMDQQSFRAMYFPVGVGNGFVAVGDDTVIVYMISEPYNPEIEQAISMLDPALGLPVPADIEPIVSDRDERARTFDDARAAGVLPDYEQCQILEQRLGQAA